MSGLVETVLVLISTPSNLVGIADFFEIPDIRTCSQIFEYFIVPLIRSQRRNPALRIFQIAENNRLRGTRLLACCLDISIRQWPLFLQCQVLGQLNPLHAQAALLHDAAGTYNDIGIKDHSAQVAGHMEVSSGGEREDRFFRVVVPVETPDLVWTIVRAIASSDTTVINLLVQSLGT